MIDWFSVAYNALWVTGCAVILAAFSHSRWLAHERGERTRSLLEAPVFQLPFTGGLFLIALGLLFLSRGWLERGIWAVFVVVFVWQLWGLWKSQRSW